MNAPERPLTVREVPAPPRDRIIAAGVASGLLIDRGGILESTFATPVKLAQFAAFILAGEQP